MQATNRIRYMRNQDTEIALWMVNEWISLRRLWLGSGVKNALVTVMGMLITWI